MGAWEEIVATALIGTGRQPVRIPTDGSPGDALLSQIDWAESEGALLRAASILAPCRRAGAAIPSAPRDHYPPAEPDALRPTGERAERHLAEILAADDELLLEEWLRLAGQNSRKIPPVLLPGVLDQGTRRESLRGMVREVADSRGRWLAAQNPKWSYSSFLTPELGNLQSVEERWQTGTRKERGEMLSVLRETQPALARDLLEGTWGQETPQDRAALLMPFSVGLSMEDEPFLEKVLDDTRMVVRRAAAQLLGQLPESRYVQRMANRVFPLVTLSGGLLKGERIELALPEACDAGMQRDAIEAKPVKKDTGERAFWLRQMIGMIPPSLWTRRLNRPPDELLKAAVRGEWGGLLEEAWRNGARRCADPEWNEAILRFWLFEGKAKGTPSNLYTLAKFLSEQSLNALCLQVFERNPRAVEKASPELYLLSTYPFAWSDELARKVIAGFRASSQRKSGGVAWHEREILKLAARCVPPFMAGELAQGWPVNSAKWAAEWEAETAEFVRILRFRGEMRDALKEDA